VDYIHSILKEPWFHGNIDKDLCNLLLKKKKGHYLVRYVDPKDTDSPALIFCYSDKVTTKSTSNITVKNIDIGTKLSEEEIHYIVDQDDITLDSNNLIDLVADIILKLKLKTPLEGSPYLKLATKELSNIDKIQH